MLTSIVVIIFIGILHYFHRDPSSQNILTTTIGKLTTTSSSSTTPAWQKTSYEETSTAIFCQRHKHLEYLGLTRKIKYSRRCILPQFDEDMDRNEITNITSSTPLITHTSLLEINNLCDGPIPPPCDSIDLPVPPPDPENKGQYTHLIFGVATSYDRLKGSKGTFAHWLANSGATLVGILTNDPNDFLDRDLASLEAEYLEGNMILKLVRKHDSRVTTEQAHTLVIGEMLRYIDDSSSSSSTKASDDDPQQHHEETVHWLAILDDDTFFPSLHTLSTTLLTFYDHTHPAYLGQLTESVSLLPQAIMGAFGGAGIFLSTPLARQISPHLDSCVQGGVVGGDVLIMQCIHKYSPARLERVPGLWQVDLIGDTAGFYESGLGFGFGEEAKTGVLSLHHWKSWHWNPVVDMTAITKICGGACFLQRFVFFPPPPSSSSSPSSQSSPESAVGVAVLNNGYSINFYYTTTTDPSSSKTGSSHTTTNTKNQKGEDKEERFFLLPDLSKMEQTWDAWPGTDAWKDYEWSLGPLRPKVAKEKKKSFWLSMSVWGDDDGDGDGGGGSDKAHYGGGGKGKGKKDLTQVYIHRAEEGEDEEAVDEVIELVWLASG